MVPQVFDPKDERWAVKGATNAVPDLCRGGKS
jgi:hypothetical protein